MRSADVAILASSVYIADVITELHQGHLSMLRSEKECRRHRHGLALLNLFANFYCWFAADAASRNM